MIILELKGTTQKGKNVVQRDGSKWRIVSSMDSVPCLDGRGGFLVQPVKGTEAQSRWIEPVNDRNFKVTTHAVGVRWEVA